MRAHVGRRLVEHKLPDAVASLAATEPLNAASLDDGDVLICVLGFEERCVAVIDALGAAGVHVETAVICRYPTNPEDNARNEQGLRDRLSELTSDAPAVLDITGDLGHAIREVVGRSTAERPRIYFDISVASNSLILRAMSVLVDCEVDLHILYAEAEFYRPSMEEFAALESEGDATGQAELARGVLDVTTMSELPGRHVVGVPERVVVFPGFDRDRVRAAISQIDNDFIIDLERAPLTWVIGQPLHEEDHWRQEALMRLHQVPPDHERHVVTTFDYRETMYALDEIYAKYGLESNLFLIALGSKMQALGTTLYCVARPDIAVVVAQPREYSAAAYSRGARQLWHLPLGDVPRLRDDLRAVGTVSVESIEQENR